MSADAPADASADGDWTPPSEAEMKVLAARRERSDKISKLMGEHLLRGFKMLASTCKICNTVELSKNGVIYCVACSEVDCRENVKDNPVLSKEALAVIAQQQQQQGGPRVEVDEPMIVPKKAYLLTTDQGACPEMAAEVKASIEVIMGKMKGARQSLANLGDADIENNAKYVNFIKDCAECIIALRRNVTS